MNLWVNFGLKFILFYKGKMAKISPKINKIAKSAHLWDQKNGTSSGQIKILTFIVQTFPKYGPHDFYFVNLSLLGAILAIFQFCWFLGLFWPFSPYEIG